MLLLLFMHSCFISSKGTEREGKSFVAFYDLTLEVTQHLFHGIILVEAAKGLHRLKEKENAPLDGEC